MKLYIVSILSLLLAGCAVSTTTSETVSSDSQDLAVHPGGKTPVQLLANAFISTASCNQVEQNNQEDYCINVYAQQMNDCTKDNSTEFCYMNVSPVGNTEQLAGLNTCKAHCDPEVMQTPLACLATCNEFVDQQVMLCWSQGYGFHYCDVNEGQDSMWGVGYMLQCAMQNCI